jgi:predicted nucleic acid-binding protein
VSVVIDASAAAEVLLRTPTGRVVVERLQTERSAEPDILDAEVASVLHRAHRRGSLGDGKLAAALDVLVDLPVARVPTRLLVRGTRRWWPSVTAYDALYVGRRRRTCGVENVSVR